MTPTTKLLTGLAAAVALSIGAVPALAQSGPIDPGVYNVDNIHPWRVFHSPSINPDADGFDLVDVSGVLEDQDLDDILEIRQRCSAVVADPSRAGATDAAVMASIPYSEATVTFCNAVFVWVAENRPDAPDTDEELWVLEAAAE